MAGKKKKTPKSFGDKLRQIVGESGTTSYSLAKQINISESTLSRFLSGERGVTLGVLDKLAEVLGLDVVVTVQRVVRPSPRGPKPRKKKTMVAATMDWDSTAHFFAMDAHKHNFKSRRGIWTLTDHGNRLCLYNNNPYARFPTLRDDELAEFRGWLKAEGIQELGFGTYSDEPTHPNYTFAMILDVGPSQEGRIADAWQRIVKKSYARMDEELDS